MKPKILLVKHFDHAILAGLALFLLYALYAAFLKSDHTVDEKIADIRRFDQTIRAELVDTDVRKQAIPDYLSELKLRFDRPAVVSRYPNDPFFRIGPRLVDTLQIVEGSAKTYKVEHVRLAEIIETNKTFLDVSFEYDQTENTSTVVIRALKPSEYETVLVRIRDVRDRVLLWRVVVLPKDVKRPPNPPADCVFRPLPPHEKGEKVVKKARVLISCRPVQPIQASDRMGATTDILIERKPAEAADVDYVTLTPKPIRTSTQQQIEALWRDFLPPPKLPPAGLPDAPSPAPAGTGGPPPAGGVWVPPVAGEARPAATESRPATSEEFSKPLEGSFVFLDTTVDPGESYVYRITTLSVSEGAKPVPCEAPYVTPSPVTVPALVAFTVESARGANARLLLKRPDPETEAPISEAFLFAPGMDIRGGIRVKRAAPSVRPGVERFITVSVDCSTNCTMVDNLSVVPRLDIQARFNVKDNKFAYRVRTVSTSLFLYLTPRGALRWKSEETSAAPAAGPAAAPAAGPAVAP